MGAWSIYVYIRTYSNKILQVKMYPRASIDNARSVRQNAHILHGQIAASAGKRIAKYMPKVVGAWLCGLYDVDRSVVEATQDSLRLVLHTSEKMKNLRKAYQEPILQYCRNAIDNETALTLNDEHTRSVSPEDAEAKYSRVISACIFLVGSLLANLKGEDTLKFLSEYESLLEDKKLWKFATHSDASVRRATHGLLKTCVEKQPIMIGQHLETISKAYLSVAPNSDQVGSVYEYVDAIALLTSKYPTVWTEYSSKAAVHKRLRQLLKKGSQYGPREFWTRSVDVFKALPEEMLPSNGADAAELLSALHAGIVRPDEPKHNLEAAWDAYFAIAQILSLALAEEDQRKLASVLILPIVSQYLEPNKANSEWAVPNDSVALVAEALTIWGMSAVAENEWPRYTQSLVDEIKTLAPEQSKDYEQSQTSLIGRVSRLASLQQSAHKAGLSVALQTAFESACQSVIATAVDVLQTRNGKPYGAAGAISEILAKNYDLLTKDAEEQLAQFIQDDLPKLILSPSSPYLVDVLYSMADTAAFKASWSAAFKVVLGAEESPAKTAALNSILTSSRKPASLNLATNDPELQEYVKSSVQGALEGSVEWDSFSRILHSPSEIISSSTTDDVLSSMTKSLSLSEQAPNALQGFRQIVKQNPAMLRKFLASGAGSSLIQSLLSASESPDDDVAHEAAAVNASVQTLLAATSNSKQSLFEVIHQGLREATSTSVSVETLVDLAKQLAKPTEESGEVDSAQVAGVFPSLKDWDEALSPFLAVRPKASLAITAPLGGALYLIDSENTDVPGEKHSRDADGYSSAYRIAQYVVKLLGDSKTFQTDRLPAVEQRHYLRNLALTVQLAGDNLGLAGANGLWAVYTPEVESEALSFLSEAHTILMESNKLQDSPALEWAKEVLSNAEAGLSTKAYYAARAASVVLSDSIEQNGWNNNQTSGIQDLLRSLRRGKGKERTPVIFAKLTYHTAMFSLLGFMNAYKEPLAASKSCERMCNELVADLTGLKIDAKPEEGKTTSAFISCATLVATGLNMTLTLKTGLRQLLLLNTILYGQEGIATSVAKQRLIFFVKHVVPWLENMATPSAVRGEVCRALATLLPLMSDIYGEHWGSILRALATSWQKAAELETESGMDRYVARPNLSQSVQMLTTSSPIPYVHASLKLYALLRPLTKSEDPNDDLLEAWEETEQDVAAGLINLLKHTQPFPDEFHQPLKIVNEVLGREAAKVPLKKLESTEDLFPLLYVESQPVQQAAFNILHKQIPAAQEQISIDAALDKSTARLPEELLSLILEAPTMAALGDASFERSIPLPLRGYLLSWLLVFDHLKHAVSFPSLFCSYTDLTRVQSFKVKTDYVEHLKEGDYLPGLLDFMFDFLGHAQSKPTDLSKLDITTYEPDVEPPKRDAQWLLAHLYFLCLRYLPSLTKSWYIDCKSRPVVVTLEPWTEKYVSPPVISAALQSVSDWATSQSQEEPDSPLTVRVHPRAREIITSYAVDEETMAMRITLPPAFPLTNPRIEGMNRVAVNDQKWQAWLRTSLGAITIFNGTLIDALTTFKRNIEGALKGQTECAICYAIVGSDRRLPDKRCSTCKNLFHGPCLFKWFKTSGGAKCPLCRQPFNYG
jgi:hypothetical protein